MDAVCTQGHFASQGDEKGLELVCLDTPTAGSGVIHETST